MNAQLIHTLSRTRTAELQHAGEQARLAREVRMSGRKLRYRNLITRLASDASRRQRRFGLDPHRPGLGVGTGVAPIDQEGRQ
jgi:hypothetical protein